MTDESPDLRWLTERIDRNHAETAADIAELKTAVSGIPAAMERYVLQRVYDADEKRRDAEREADRAQLAELKNVADTKTREVRTAVLAGISAVAAAIVVAVLTKSGVWH